jgi:hypothetical protein
MSKGCAISARSRTNKKVPGGAYVAPAGQERVPIGESIEATRARAIETPPLTGNAGRQGRNDGSGAQPRPPARRAG